MNVIGGKDEKDFTSVEYQKQWLDDVESFDFSKVRVGYYKSFLESPALDKGIQKSLKEIFQRLKEK